MGKPRHSLIGPALPTGSGKLGGEASHLPHLRPLPESQSTSSPMLQTAPGVKGHQRVVTLAQHISVTTHPLLAREGTQSLSRWVAGVRSDAVT